MQSRENGLLRAIGRWSLTALMVNLIIGAGIFALPAAAAAMLGTQSPLAYVYAAAGMGVIAACVAEVASRFHEGGGPYLYARAAFGSFVGLQTGWLLWLTRLSSAAAVANVFLDYLAGFWPESRMPLGRLGILTVLIGGLAVINVRGVKTGTWVSNALTVAKLVPLLLLVAAGLWFVSFHASPVGGVVQSRSPGTWLSAVLLLIYAFSGFESALIPAGEVRDPGRDVPWALLVALPTVALIYVLVQVVVVNTIAAPAETTRPLAAAALVAGGDIAGQALARIVAFGALLSTLGSLAANMVATPRITFALAQQRDFPRWFGAIHPRYQTPHASVVAFAVLLWALAVVGTFRWNAALSAVSRLVTYAITCAALPVLRRKNIGKAGFHLAGGDGFAAVGLLFAVVIASRMGRAELITLALCAGLASLNWLALQRPPLADAAK